MSLDLAGEHAPSLPDTAPFGASTGRRRSTPRAHVVAVVLARDGVARLPRVLAALATATRPADAVVAVDLGSRDGSAALLAGAAMPVLELPRRASPADAVEAVLAARAAGSLTHGDDAPPAQPDVVEWLWLLPQEGAPAPDALEQLLLGVENAPSVGVAGCKQVAWDDDQRLLDVGFTASPLGLRVTGVDRGEVDQGQHDGRSDVLAVSGAGMLVRRDVWEELGGLDPDLDDPLGGAAADLDLCRRAHRAGHRVVVVPAAVVARAAPTRSGGPPRRAARRAALHLRLAGAPLPLVPPAAAAVLLAGAVHALVLLVAGRGAAARDELAATAAALARPLAWRRTRRRQLRARRVPAQVLRRLRPGPDLLWRQRYDAFRGWLTPPGAGATAQVTSRWRGAGLPLLLAAVAGGVAARAVVLGGGSATGSGRVPAPASSGLLWSAATSSWRDVGLGVRAPGDPYGALLAILGVVAGGDPARATTLLLATAVPLAALTAWIAAAVLTPSRLLRTWAALGWAAAPPLLAAVVAGSVPTELAHALLPLAAVALAGAAGLRPVRRPLASAARLGLLLTAVLAAAPGLAAPAAAVLAGTAVAGRRRALGPLALAAAIPAVLLLPWWAAVVRTPTLLLADPAPAGLPPDVPLAAAAVALVVAPVAGAAVLGVLRRRAGGAAALGWWVAGTGVATAAAGYALAATGTSALTGTMPTALLPSGPAASLALAGLGAAALLGGDAALNRLRRTGRRRPRLARSWVAAAAAVALLGPLGAGALAAWLGTTTGRAPVPLPAVARAEAASPAATRTLLLQVTRAPGSAGPAGVRWALAAGAGPELGDASTALPPRALDRDAAVVLPVLGQVLSETGGDPRPALADLAVGSVVLLPPADPATVLALDAAAGLDRFGDAHGALLWRVEPPPGVAGLPDPAAARPARARILEDAGHTVRALSWRQGGGVDTGVPPGAGDRLVVLAERFDAGWHARLDGAQLVPVRWHGWAQAFRLPGAGGRLEVSRDEGRVRLADPARAGVLAVALLAALPLPRLRGRGEAPAPARPSRPLPRPAPAPDDLRPAPPPQVFDDEHPEDATRPLHIGPLPRRRRRRRLWRAVAGRRRTRRETP